MEPDDDLDATQVVLYPDEVNDPATISALCLASLVADAVASPDDD